MAGILYKNTKGRIFHPFLRLEFSSIKTKKEKEKTKIKLSVCLKGHPIVYSLVHQIKLRDGLVHTVQRSVYSLLISVAKSTASNTPDNGSYEMSGGETWMAKGTSDTTVRPKTVHFPQTI